MEQINTENINNKSSKKIGKNAKKNFSWKSYLREFILFVDKKLLKTIGILLIVSIVLMAICFNVVSGMTIEQDKISLFENYFSKLQVLAVTGVAGIVPYIFAPVVGFLGYVLSELTTFIYAVKMHGYFLGIILGIIPLLLNLLSISIVTALGIYLCKTVTIGYKMSNIKNMNWLNFRIRLYETLQKQDKVEKLKKQKESKIDKLEAKKEKINYLQILNIAIVVFVLQFISVLIQHIML